MAVTPIDVLKKFAEGEEVELPAFSENVPFVAKLRRPSMLVLCKSGKIPNQLLKSASTLFAGNTPKALERENGMQDMLAVIDVICEASFVSPTWKELKDNGIELTDEQMMAVFSYSQQGIKALEQFRKD